MIFETILLNRLHKSNQFSRLKPRILEDRVVFAITDNLKICSTGNLTKAQPTDILCTTAETEEYFDCKTAQSGDILYLGMELQFAYQVLHICKLESYYDEEQMAYCQYWVSVLYSSLQDPFIEREVINEDEQIDEKLRHQNELSEQALKALQMVDKYLLKRSFMAPHQLSFADIFLVSVLKRKNLLETVKMMFQNIERVVCFVHQFFLCDVDKLFNQETKIFQNIHHHTSSAQFLLAIRKNDLEKAKQIALLNPWAVNGREPQDQQLTCAHIAVRNRDMALLSFLEQFPQMNFDMGDCDGETPLFYSLSSKQLEMTKFFVQKGANLSHKSTKRGWSPIYVAATLSNIESLEYLVSLGCDVNLPTFIGRTALTKTCWMGREDSVKVLLKHSNIDLEWKANSQRTALQHAVWGPYGGKDGIKHGTNPKDSPGCARLLLEAGADPMNRDVKGKTPLHTACQTGGADCVPILLDYGADINARLNSGGTPLHSCCYFGNHEPFLALLKYVETHPQIKIDTDIRQAQGYTALESTIPHDENEFVQLLIEKEQYILSLGLKGLTFGDHNYCEILNKCLKHGSYKSMAIILDKYKSEKQTCLDFVDLLSKALQSNQTPDFIILKLFNFLMEQNISLHTEQKLKLLWGFCKSETITDDSEVETLSCIDKLLAEVETIPIVFVQKAIKMAKYTMLQKIFAHLSFVTNASIQKHKDSQVESPVFILEEESYLSDVSILSLAMQVGNEILKLLLEETDVRVEERQKNGDTYIHEACRIGVDMQILETLLIHLRQVLIEPEQVQKFLEQKNNDGVSPLDYCMLKNRYDMGVVLKEFVVTSQSIVDIKSFKVIDQFRLKDFQNTAEYLKLKSLDFNTQYSTAFESYKFQSVENTPFQWVETGQQLAQVSKEIENDLQMCNVLAVDLEYHNVQRQATILSLVQLSTYRKDYIIDSLKLRNLEFYYGLRGIFENAKYVKIFHGGDSDIQLLASDLDICSINVFDTARSYQFLQKLHLLVQLLQQGKTVEKLSLNFISLEKITKLFLNVDLDKTFQVADWRIRPLPKGMLDYARNDSHYLIPIYMIIMEICRSGLQSKEIPKSLADQDWFQKAKTLPFLDQFDILGQMALMTNKFIIAKLCKNNYNRVVVQF